MGREKGYRKKECPKCGRIVRAFWKFKKRPMCYFCYRKNVHICGPTKIIEKMPLDEFGGDTQRQESTLATKTEGL